MAHPYWPLYDLRLRTPRLELRPPTDDDLLELARLAARGIHDPGQMPFAIPWTDLPSPDLERGVFQYYWRCRGAFGPGEWWLDLAAYHGGQLVGVQGVGAKDFKVLRTVNTGSWVGRSFQRQGYGREMRAAVLHLAFAGLGAEVAISSAFADNAASERVSRALGYREDGTERKAPRGEPREVHRFRIDRGDWERTRRIEVEMEDPQPCLMLLGLAPTAR